MSKIATPKTTTIIRVFAVAIALGLLSGSFGCSKPVVPLPDKAAPGDAVFLRHEKAHFQAIDDIRVTFDEDSANVVRVVDDTTIEVLVPKHEPGQAVVKVSDRGRPVGIGIIAIVPPPLRRLFLTMDNGAITLNKIRPYNGHFDPVAANGTRVSYDVFDAKGKLLYTGAVPHPGDQTIESFGPPGKTALERKRVKGPVLFIVKIPNANGAISVKFFTVEDGVDIFDVSDRQSREFITEIRIKD